VARTAAVGVVSVAAPSVRPMVIDCDSCTAGPGACTDCLVSFLTIGVGPPGVGVPTATVELDTAEERALGVLAEHGLVPPLRMERAG